MTQLAEKAVEWTQRHQSRRGFMALSGKVALALGLAMVGAASVKPHEAHAATCCGGSACSNCQSCTNLDDCPSGCTFASQTSCCDNGTGGSFTILRCTTCSCGGLGCQCICNTNVPCT